MSESAIVPIFVPTPIGFGVCFRFLARHSTASRFAFMRMWDYPWSVPEELEHRAFGDAGLRTGLTYIVTTGRNPLFPRRLHVVGNKPVLAGQC
jgi:hypothetical protein